MDGEKRAVFLLGINSVLEKFRASPQEVFEVLIARGRQRAALHLIDKEARRQGLPVCYLESEALDRLVDGRKHQGVVAKVDSYSYGLFANLLQDLPSLPRHDWILVLDGLTDPHNFGALLRSAEGVGIRHVIIPKDRSVGVTPTVVKSSAGAVYYLKICRVSNLRRALLTLKEKGYWVIGLDAEAKEGVYGRVYPEKLVVVLGAEGAGIRPLIRRECDFLASIPMRGKIASLNVSVAGGIFLYELLRQKGQA
ncbi:MAG: 23S rRNA (guanosine(2251)-2'-O)-methyltransferase RlmB [Deltaproteobacteria bacterium]|nr:23S rRNA (guanosine(2251)-2'-O)-methyltransferase RlmB [Deltaproteobacteria bacterium]